VKLGVLLLPSLSWPRLLEHARGAEAAGFDAVWIDDHLVDPRDPAAPWLEVWTTLAGLAAATETIRVGPLVSNIILRHPALLAREALTVDAIAPGRLEVGIGAGYAASDHAALGEEPWGDAERFRRFAAAVESVRAQIGEIPLAVAAHGDKALGLAARFGDVWVSYGGFGLPPDEALALTRLRCERLSELAEGRTVKRRLLAGSAALTQDPIWQSVGAFDDFVGRYSEAGIDELALHWPPQATNPNVRPEVVDEITARLST
jgi:alkanesulfonate monooxygenase SsuD/methylene tetrahydromethanopterin reductase-like flavin-dependent oxidoreductase (luciferase family)